MMIDVLIEKIVQNSLFLKLKGVIENNAYHSNEDVYSHAIKTKNIALKELSGNFITNPEAKNSFLKFVNEEHNGFKRADLMVLIALLHDIGKILSVKEGSMTRPLMISKIAGITACPGHEYLGAAILGLVLKSLSLKIELLSYIGGVIRLHDTFNAEYWAERKDWSMDLLINDVKSSAEGLYKEALFNIYCDCFTADIFKNAKEMIIKVFNEPLLYERREYVII